MEVREKILIIEDDKKICNYMRTALTANDYSVICASRAMEGLDMIRSHRPDLILLDLGLPDADGMLIIKEVRRKSTTPIIVVSARTDESDKVAALDAGADDYITKPFGKAELAARVRAALRFRRIGGDRALSDGSIYRCGGLYIDFGGRTVSRDGKSIRLTRIEYKILETLCEHSGKVITYDYMLKHIWGPYAKNDNKILRVNITNIRRKLEPDTKTPRYIFTEPGIGYRMAENEL